MKWAHFIGCCLLSIMLLSGCGNEQIEEQTTVPVVNLKETSSQPENNPYTTKVSIGETQTKQIELSNFNRQPIEWGERVTGVKLRMETDEKKIALTFDACGGEFGSHYDDRLISFLIEEKVPATLFVNERWIHANERLFLQLAANPLFQIENHGTNHAPLSVVGGEAWGIQATTTPEEAYDEIMQNHQTVKALTGKDMTLFRSGTAYYDEVAVELAQKIGYEVVNYDVLGDAGATFTNAQVKQALVNAKEGSIVLLHMNQPKSGTAQGVMDAIPLLRENGFTFVQLSDEVN